MRKKDKFIDHICKLSSVPRFAGTYLAQPQSGGDHAFRVAMISLLIVDEYNSRNETKINREEVLLKSLIHDCEEAWITDLPSPVKYITPEFRDAVAVVEKKVMKEIILKDAGPSSDEYFDLWKNAKKGDPGKIVKIADKIEGFIKINFEINHGNKSLIDAYYETVEWFEENEELLAPFKAAQEMVSDNRIEELDLKK